MEILDNCSYLIADTVLSIQSKNIVYPDGLSPLYTPFRTQLEPDIKVTIERTKTFPKKPKDAKIIFKSLPSWILYEKDNLYHFEFHSFENGQKDRYCSITKDFTEVKMYVKKANWNYQTMLRPILEIVLVNYFASREGLLLHAAAIRNKAEGYTFIGKSGAGKTTTTGFWKDRIGDYSILGDERTIIRRIDGEWYVYGTPWPGIGMIIENKKVPLKHIMLIEHGKGKDHRIFSDHPVRLFQDIFAQVFSSYWSHDVLNQLSQTIESMLQDIPCHRYAFLRDPSCADYLIEWAESGRGMPRPYDTIVTSVVGSGHAPTA